MLLHLCRDSKEWTLQPEQAVSITTYHTTGTKRESEASYRGKLIWPIEEERQKAKNTLVLFIQYVDLEEDRSCSFWLNHFSQWLCSQKYNSTCNILHSDCLHIYMLYKTLLNAYINLLSAWSQHLRDRRIHDTLTLLLNTLLMI